MGELLAGKTVIVTGAGGGIGLATALHLLEEGAQVVATVHKKSSLPELKVDNDNLVARVVDVADEQQVKDVIAFAVRTFGKLDGIVNNAGVLIPGTILDASVEDYQRTFDVNVKGVFLGSQSAIPELIKAGGGSDRQLRLDQLDRRREAAGDLHRQQGCRPDADQGHRAGLRRPGSGQTRCAPDSSTPRSTSRTTPRLVAVRSSRPDCPTSSRSAAPILPREIAQPVAFLISDHSPPSPAPHSSSMVGSSRSLRIPRGGLVRAGRDIEPTDLNDTWSSHDPENDIADVVVDRRRPIGRRGHPHLRRSGPQGGLPRTGRLGEPQDFPANHPEWELLIQHEWAHDPNVRAAARRTTRSTSPTPTCGR